MSKTPAALPSRHLQGTTGENTLAWRSWFSKHMEDENYPYRTYLALPEKIYLPIPDSLTSTALAKGAHQDKRGLYSTPEARCLTALHDLLPLGYNGLPGQILVELIPKTAHFGSLARNLDPRSWQRIKAPYIAATGGRCQVCGFIAQRDPVFDHSHSRSIEAHEIWSYHLAANSNNGIQRLDHIMPLCPSCHLMFHLGYADGIGLGEYIVGRLQCFNMWDDATAIPRLSRFFQIWEQRSQKQWIADVSIVDDDMPLVISPANAKYADRLTGVPFKIGARGTPSRNTAPTYHH